MLVSAESLKDLNFSKLMAVYEEGNREHGRELYPHEPPQRQLALAEQDFYQYLRECFFPTAGARYLIWEESGQYISALRLEPYQDGLLLEALETLPDFRRQGYASRLLHEVLENLGTIKVYSHVHKRNLPSLGVHNAAGFRRILEHAVYADGSVLHNSCTLLFLR